MIPIDILRAYGAIEKSLPKGQMLFEEGDKATFYYQILTGRIKMHNYNEKGQEMIQGIFEKGQSFGEPPIFGKFPYPAYAEAIEDSLLICLNTDSLRRLLENNIDFYRIIIEQLSKRLRYKAILAKEIKGHDAPHRILTLLEYLKAEAGISGKYKINLTRQTIANLMGLRVETVIRATKTLAQKGKLTIENRVLYL